MEAKPNVQECVEDSPDTFNNDSERYANVAANKQVEDEQECIHTHNTFI